MKNIVFLAILCTASSSVFADSGLDHWFQNTDDKYGVKIDKEHRATGNSSALLYSLSEDKYSEGALLQTLSPCPATVGNLKFSAFLKSDSVSGAGLVVDVILPHGFTRYRHQEDEITGSTTWTLFEKKVNVPYDCAYINIGVYLKGTGKVWVDDFKLEEIDDEEILSKVSKEKNYAGPDKIRSPGFEE